MKLSIVSFTGRGVCLSQRIEKELDGFEVVLYTKYSGCPGTQEAEGQTGPCFCKESIAVWAGKQMEEKNALLFIGACGIAVRAIAPHLTDKLHDSPVLVMDEAGKYVIPLLSGHVGGANELAALLAERLGANPVITTATDLNQKFAVDLFARRNNLSILNKAGIARVSTKVLDGKPVTVSVERGHLCKNDRLPSSFSLIPYPPEEPVDIVIASEDREFAANILLRPKEYIIGMGCKKGKEEEALRSLVHQTLGRLGISPWQIFALASIDLKKEEPGLKAFTSKERIPFLTYTARELGEVSGEFRESEFVKSSVGVANVCERAALLACGKGGKIVCGKYAEDGMTIAIAKREWSVSFDEGEDLYCGHGTRQGRDDDGRSHTDTGEL